MRTWNDNPSQWDSTVSIQRELKATTLQKIKVIKEGSTGRSSDKYTKYPKFASNSRSRQEIKVINYKRYPIFLHTFSPRRSEKLKRKKVQQIFAMGITEVEILLMMGLMTLMGLIYWEKKNT